VQNQSGETCAFGFRAVQDKAPSASGVYTVYTSRQWVYVGESDDIRQSLFGHLNDPDGCSKLQRGPLSFSFEIAAGPERATRRQALAAELAPICEPDQH
jgi:hypothetical protein